MSARARDWSTGEQGSAIASDAAVRAALAEAVAAYERRFARIYIVCASGRRAGELLSDIEARLRNDPEHELRVAMLEQGKITALRLRKLVGVEEET